MIKKVKLFLGISILINVIIVSLFAYKVFNNWFETGVLKNSFRESIFNAIPNDYGKIYFVGDSHTEAFELNELLNNKDVRNRGIWGDASKNVLKRFNGIIRQHPKKIFLMIGVNDICSGVKNDRIYANVEKIIKTAKDSLPATKLYIESVLPTTNPILHSKESTILKITELNTKYKELASKYDATYIDLYSHFIQNEELKLEYSNDGLHLNGKGYLELAKLIKPFVEE
jgi:lysophospholipase L1-like esterase